jgi:hypothetical protein
LSERAFKIFDAEKKKVYEDLEEVNFAQFILKAEEDINDTVLDDCEDDSDYDIDEDDDMKLNDVYPSVLRSQCEIIYFHSRFTDFIRIN